MVFFWLQKRYVWSSIFLFLSLLTKEQVGLTTAAFCGYVVIGQAKTHKWRLNKIVTDEGVRWGAALGAVSIFWVLFSFKVMIPFFRGGGHFALSRYENVNVLTTIFLLS